MNPYHKQPEGMDDSLLKSILQGSTHGMLLVDDGGKIVYANATAADIFEYDRDELLGLAVEDLVPQSSRSEHKHMRQDYQQDPVSRPMGEGRDLHGVTRSGERVPVEIGLNPIEYQEKRMVIADIVEISERKKLERQLEKTNRKLEEQLETKSQQLKQLTENIDAVFWMDDLRNDEQLYVSPKYEDIWERPREDFHEDTFAFLEGVVPEDRDRVRAELEKMQTGGYDIEYRIETPDGVQKWIHDRAFPIENEQGSVVKIAGIAEDITERKMIEVELRETLDEKETLLREVHHRVKNNLQIISSILHLAIRNTSSTDARSALNESRFRIHSIAKVHQSLYEHDQLRGIQLAQYIENLVEELKNFITTEPDEVRVHYDLDETIQSKVSLAIPSGLAVTELVTNAFKYASDNGHGRPELHVVLERDSEEELKVVIQDNGPGYPEDFDPETGSELGLSLVRKLVKDQLDGQVTFENDKGAKATLIIPFSESDQDLSGAPENPSGVLLN